MGKIVYIHQYFKTPREPGGTRSYWLSKEFIKNGHSVTMITTSSDITESEKRVNIDGIDVIYLKVPYDNAMSIFKRLMSFVKFMLRATVVARKQDADLVIATSTPLTVGLPALILKKKKKVPYFFEVRDLWPEVPIQMGALKNPVIKGMANWFEKLIYKNATHLIALSPGMAQGIHNKDVPYSRIATIPNMAKIDEFWQREKNTELMVKLGLKPESFKVIHFGAMGLANGLEYVIEAAKLLKNESDIEFIFLGGGSTETQLKQKSVAEGLTNIHFLGKHPMETTSEIVNACNVSLVSFLDIPILYTNSPNKLFDSLSAGKPIIVNSRGWTKQLVEDHNCGYYVNPSYPQDMVDKILHLKNNPSLVVELGLNSRKLAVEKYDKSILCAQFAELINNHFSLHQR